VLYGKTKEQLIEREWVSDVLSKPSESRGKPETSVETPRVEKGAVVYHRGFAGLTLEPYKSMWACCSCGSSSGFSNTELNLSNAKAYVWLLSFLELFQYRETH
jgi:hypothetical protein